MSQAAEVDERAPPVAPAAGRRERPQRSAAEQARALARSAPVLLLFVAALYSTAHVLLWWARSDLLPNAVVSIVLPSMAYEDWPHIDSAVHRLGTAALDRECPALQVVVVGCLRPLPEFAKSALLTVSLVSACHANGTDPGPDPAPLYAAAARHVTAPYVLLGPLAEHVVREGYPKSDHILSARFLKGVVQRLQEEWATDIVGATSCDANGTVVSGGAWPSRVGPGPLEFFHRGRGLKVPVVRDYHPVYEGASPVTRVFAAPLAGAVMSAELWRSIVAEAAAAGGTATEGALVAASKALGARHGVMEDYIAVVPRRLAQGRWIASLAGSATVDALAAKFVRDTMPLQGLNVVWDLYCGCTGLNNEAINYLVPLETRANVAAVAGQGCWCGGYPDHVRSSLARIGQRRFDRIDVWVSHKPPKSYPTFPYHGLWKVPVRPKYVIGRSMSESAPIPPAWLERFALVDEVWVPSHWHRAVFASSGVPEHKLRVVPEAIDTRLYDPEVVVALELPAVPSFSRRPFRFLSVFKWEPRKGPDVLLRAYWEAFSDSDDVVLYLHTYMYQGSDPRNAARVADAVRAAAVRVGLGEQWDRKTLPPVVVLSRELSASEMPRLYKAADAFVLPTRGEGWGMPIMEAMAMQLPTIATNWSGCTMLVDAETAYPLDIEGLERAEDVPGVSGANGPSQPQWAKPSVAHLKELMRSVYFSRGEAARKGLLARKKIVAQYSQERVADIVESRLSEIQALIQ
eukprot:m51a1_g10014 hypothetical protein (744) ;mRNA; r:29499-33434